MNLYLIDGNSYVYRAFFAIKNLSSSGGMPTNAIYGFTNMLLKIIREKKPDGLVVLFDTPAPTERHRLYEEYKAHRPEAPSDLVIQLPHIRRMIRGFNIKIIEIPGYEADDLIGTLAKRAGAEGTDVLIVTADKDMLQLVDDRIRVYDPLKDRLLDSDYVKEKFGVGPERVTEFMALTGDASDNIPGIKGVGEKTARELLLAFESLDDLLDHPERIKRPRLREMVAANREVVLLSKKLATIDTAVPVEIEPQEFRMTEPDWLALLGLFREFEFTTLMKLLPAAAPHQHTCEVVNDPGAIRAFAASVKGSLAFEVEATGRNALLDNLVGIALSGECAKSCYLPVFHTAQAAPAGMADTDAIHEILGPVFRDEAIAKIGHNLKYDIMMLRKEGMQVSGPLYDTMIAAYLLNPNKSNHSLEEVAFEYLSRRKKAFIEVLGKRSNFAEVPVEEAAAYAGEDAALSLDLREVLFRRLEETGLSKVYFEIEMPLVSVLADMEEAGIKIDDGILIGLSQKLAVEIESITRRIYFLAGEEFNINSPRQLGAILFHSLGLSPSKRTKTGFSTGMDVLEELAAVHELPREVLHYRSLAKLKTTYLDVLPAIINPRTGRVHTSFNQTVTATGRLSSSDPNLQNIPIRGEWGRRIRDAFIAEEDCTLLSADYSQVELRILAHLSGDEGLIDAFTQGLDIHTRTAAELYGVPLEKVTAEMRRTAKTVNFGVLYGISAFGLSETLGIDRKEADAYIKRYFLRHPGVTAYIEKSLRDATQKGFVTTLFGRSRPIPELKSSNRNIRQQGERLAVNSPIQGTAADIIKVAMIRIHRLLGAEGLGTRMILQVHDELLFEAPHEELERVEGMVRAEMEGVVSLLVPLRVEIGHGRTWAEAH